MSLSLVLMSPSWVMHRFCNFVVEIQSVYCGTNTQEAALGGLETWMTSEQSTAPQPVGCFNLSLSGHLKCTGWGFSSASNCRERCPSEQGMVAHL